MKSIKMFTIVFFISFIAFITCDQESCRKVPLNGDNIFGECCVFMVDDELPRYENGHVAVIKDSVAPSRNRKIRQLSPNQKPQEGRSPQIFHGFSPYNAHLRPDTDGGRTRSEKLNSFTPTPLKKVVIAIGDDNVYGDCSLFAENGPLHHDEHKRILVMVKDYLSFMSNAGNIQPSRAPGIELSPSDYDQSHISSKRAPQNNIQKVNTQPIYLHNTNKEISLNHKNHNEVMVTNAYNAFDVSIVDNDSAPNNFNRRERPHKHAVKDFTVPDQQPDITMSKPISKTLSEEDFSESTFNIEEGGSTTSGGSSLSTDDGVNETKLGKTVDVGNRNAVDVPAIACPEGQSRDPSGTCVTPF